MTKKIHNYIEQLIASVLLWVPARHQRRRRESRPSGGSNRNGGSQKLVWEIKTSMLRGIH